MVTYLLSGPLKDKSLEAVQCLSCGRIWIENSLAPGHFRSFRPDAAGWRGTFDVHEAGFLAYEAETTFYGCRLKKIKQRRDKHRDTVKVIWKCPKGKRVVARFVGVKSMEKRIPRHSIPALDGLCVRHLGKWEAETPWHRYVFEDYYNRDPAGHLTIVAQGFKLRKGSNGKSKRA